MSESLYTSLAQFGIVGLILAWFMLRMEQIITKNSESIAELNKTLIKVEAVIRKCPGAQDEV